MAVVCALPGCHKPVWASAGIQHDYCGRTHAQQALGQLPAPHGICHTCNLHGCEEQVYFDEETGRVHDFCCKTHAEQAIANGEWRTSLRSQRAGSSNQLRCALPGCNAPRFTEAGPYARQHDFCGRTHALLARDRGLTGTTAGLPIAQERPETVDRVFSGGGTDAYTIAVLTRQHPKYDNIKQQFLNSWVHPGPKPRVRRLLQVRNAAHVYEEYQRYQSNRPSEVRRFHGTSLSEHCSFGVDLRATPCTQNDCAVCGICRVGFDLDRGNPNGASRMSLRYGVGHYFSRTSSKSNDYATNSERCLAGRRTRMMFLCKVVPGRIFDASEESMSPDEIPPGFDSLEARSTSQGGPLNHDELVIYRNDAAIPSYLIVYEI